MSLEPGRKYFKPGKKPKRGVPMVPTPPQPHLELVPESDEGPGEGDPSQVQQVTQIWDKEHDQEFADEIRLRQDRLKRQIASAQKQIETLSQGGWLTRLANRNKIAAQRKRLEIGNRNFDKLLADYDEYLEPDTEDEEKLDPESYVNFTAALPGGSKRQMYEEILNWPERIRVAMEKELHRPLRDSLEQIREESIEGAKDSTRYFSNKRLNQSQAEYFQVMDDIIERLGLDPDELRQNNQEFREAYLQGGSIEDVPFFKQAAKKIFQALLEQGYTRSDIVR
ncbi:hypothetical protein ACFL2M_00505 [Patescibacteria group bacterium]